MVNFDEFKNENVTLKKENVCSYLDTYGNNKSNGFTVLTC
jgi:hypothetical protein